MPTCLLGHGLKGCGISRREGQQEFACICVSDEAHRETREQFFQPAGSKPPCGDQMFQPLGLWGARHILTTAGVQGRVSVLCPASRRENSTHKGIISHGEQEESLPCTGEHMSIRVLSQMWALREWPGLPVVHSHICSPLMVLIGCGSTGTNVK